ncbi:alpha-methylacyl-CoA racemase [Marinobacterium sp. MBR-111]|uniref:CaiB/BaiF CoA transferase family protein n=1 Tax=Marinobacterium sp. MBR-111 TaxID=3156463 RepID=UPI003394F83B
MSQKAGPLAHMTVVEFAGLGPAPFAGMVLSDLGARVIRIDRAPKSTKSSVFDEMTARHADVLSRGRESIALDLKQPEAVEIALELIAQSDALLEGYRPGVMESLGLGPEQCLQKNSRLVYGRITGWGQTGPLAQSAGHDINYLALTGALHATGKGKPVPTPGLIGDFGGGGMLLLVGLLAAFSEAQRSGKGQVVDASICDGSALLTALIQGWHSVGLWSNETGTNMGDGGAHFYNTYRCADGKYISIGSVEPQFYSLLREHCGLTDSEFEQQWDKRRWADLQSRVEQVIAGHDRDYWTQLLEGTDVCFAPVLDLDEAPEHPHNKVRNTFAKVNGITQPAPAPKFSRSALGPCQDVGKVGDKTCRILEELGFTTDQVAQFKGKNTVWYDV